ncbi:response regulator [Arenimonas composti]|uniref:histidine kinase n=1 Tax=Arenimonas composti TR7-09 = DSM 18010 TaxID=1121013 RepID=A0A091C0V4_9GAMM|nr:response regulator [Arenimonas composti]KFN50260.1 hypothetical protein P873_07840 [Arenimonas composti TR7-09 = DSM 18010]
MSVLPFRVFAGFVLAAIAVILIGALSWQALEERGRAVDRIERGNALIAATEGTLLALRDMETSQRGYLLTGSERYLLPLTEAEGRLPALFGEMRELGDADADQARDVSVLIHLAEEKSAELHRTIDLYREGDREEALRLVRTDQGRELMQQARALVARMVADQRERLAQEQAGWQAAADSSYAVTLGGLSLLLVLIGIAAWMAARDHRASVTQAWLRSGQMGLSERLQGDRSLEALATEAMDFLAAFLEAPLAAVHAGDGDGLAHVTSRGRADADGVAAAASGLVRQAIDAKAPLRVRDLPADYFRVESSLGGARVRELLLVPARVDGRTVAVVELGFFRAVRAEDVEFAARVSEMLGIAVRAAQSRRRLEELLEETQRQAEELQTQQEELRVSNEELEEQSRLARQAQTLLEHQQRELEQTNTVLEEQATQLESQRDALAEAQANLEQRAAELERVNRYKSEFLANMSHELRTPLNSTLILSRLLADNRGGRLSDEEVGFARIIHSAGNDLLALINDILDLSKIEAGKLDVVIEPIAPAALVRELAESFAPTIHEKGLSFQVDVAAAAEAAELQTDRQRLAQILRNLLSNALKFTEAGSVVLRLETAPGDRLAFSVVDTGIGMPEDQHEVIFEAFRQADGSTHRRYGGTGLGLSISRDLARRLGGDLTVTSAVGRGSTFTLVLPRQAVVDAEAEPMPLPATPAKTAMPATPAPAPAPVGRAAPARHGAHAPITGSALADDRDTIASGDRVILAVEDDPGFAAILRDLVQEAGFRCLLAHTGADGLAAAQQYTPHAILLDVVLPDLSGMGVLEQLKRDPRTRHIPVHMLSVADFSREARELGAVGYALKPVERSQLQEALKTLERKFSQQDRRVLVVEDDEHQRISLTALLQTDDIRIVTAENAAAALDLLGQMSFDCMVLDLHLPDMTGYQLLEHMASRDDLAFPPVIVHTGRNLSREEEQRLLAYSESIILKGARSPERLLDEVTLFLHQVEARLPPATQQMLQEVRGRDEVLDGRRVLVVEDDVRNVHALTAVLRPRGVRVDVARNGREALEMLDAQDAHDPFELVLMDIMMPEMDGLTATRKIRERKEWNRIPVIALTAKAMRDDREQCMAAGANDYIAKPLDVDRLLSLVRVWMPKRARP